MSCAGNGYLSGNMLVPFPFEDGQVLGWSQDPEMANEVQTAFQRCVVDAAAHIAASSIPDRGWPSLSVKWILPALSKVVVVLHACGYDSEIEITSATERFPIYAAKAGWGSYILVASSEGVSDFLSFCIENNISPPASGSSSPSGRDGVSLLRLCDRCVTLRPAQLDSLRVLDGMDPPAFRRTSRRYAVGDVCWRNGFYRCVSAVSEGAPWKASDWEEVSASEVSPTFSMTGDVAVKPGNNMTLSSPEDSMGIGLNAVPGAGLGIVSCGCSGRAEKVSPIMSHDGQTRLFNDTCYDLEPADFFTRVVDGEERRARNLKIHSKCTACCTCEMYESIVNERLKALADAIRAAKADLEGDLVEYEDAVERFNQRIAKPTLDDIKVSLSGMPIGRNVGSKVSGEVSGKMNRCAYTAMVRNSSYATVLIYVAILKATDDIVEASVSWTDEEGVQKTTSGDSERAIVNKWFEMLPGRSVAITFVSAKKAMVGSVSTGGYKGEMTMVAAYIDQKGETKQIKGLIQRSVEV